MTPDDRKTETRFKCPNCQQPIVSRFTYCKQCETKFGRDTLFSCPRCGALVRQLERVCPGCEARLTDWGVGAEWLGKPLASASQKVEAPKEIEPGPSISKPLPELKRPEQVEQSPKPAPALIPLPELKKPDQPDRSRIFTPAPTQKPAPSKITRAEAMGRTNGLRHGRVNGTKQGLVNGTSRGRVNGTKKGLVNGTKQGRVNGFKAPVASDRREESSLMHRMIGGRIPAWQLVAISFVVILLLSSAVILSLAPATPGQNGIVIDGQFSDWASISSYRFSDLLPGNIPQVIEAKMNASDDHLNLYLRVQDNAFTGNDPSTFYVLIDADSNVDTGYLVSGHQLGTDRLITLSGWDGRLMDSFDSNFSGTDQNNWTAWQSGKYVAVMQSQSEIEMSIPYLSSNSLVQLETTVTGREYNSPIMSTHGTVVAEQESLLTGQLATTATQPITRLSAIVMGVPSGNITITATITNDTNASLASQNLQISTSSWTTHDITVDLSSLSGGDSFSIKTTFSSLQFAGPIEVDGEPIRGYYLLIPATIVVDGVFGDWFGKKISDSDPVQMSNPNIDIIEYGACTQNSSHFFYVSVVGDALGGADVPEVRSKPSSGGGNPSPVVRLRKTGEDLLQAFIDKDPGNGTGLSVAGGGKIIGADYLVEMYGRRGHVTSSSVMQWSNSTQKWTSLGGIEKIGVGGQGIEFSVNKTALGNLTAAEVIILTTDWKTESDNCWLKNALSDPWAITTTGRTYTSSDGISWSAPVGISLVSGDTVVAIAHSLDFAFAFAVTNTGRVYSWEVGVSTSWGTNVTNPTNVTNIVGIAPNLKGGTIGAYILSSYGCLWSVNTLSGTGQSWVYNTVGNGKVANGITNFKDITYQEPGKRYYAMRSGSNTPVYWAPTTLASWTTTALTGSSATQSHIYHVGAAGQQSNEEIFVLCQNGNIRYSADGGSTWGNRGDLPAPGSGPQSYAKYIAIDRDTSGVFWAITNTSYCYRSADTGSTWTYRGNFAMKNVTSMACPNGVIPEFDSLLIPITLIVLPIIAIMRKRRRQP